eukprot:13781236-Alexandrium_andersonii.AAC.1
MHRSPVTAWPRLRAFSCARCTSAVEGITPEEVAQLLQPPSAGAAPREEPPMLQEEHQIVRLFLAG